MADYRQKPTEALDYFVPIAAGSTITSTTWSLTPSDATLGTPQNSSNGSQCRVGTGLKYGVTYRLVCSILFSTGVRLDSEITIQCDRNK